jgi:hypothetical protein
MAISVYDGLTYCELCGWYVERFRIITVHEDEPRRTDRMAVCETCRDKLSLAHPQARR